MKKVSKNPQNCLKKPSKRRPLHNLPNDRQAEALTIIFTFEQVDSTFRGCIAVTLVGRLIHRPGGGTKENRMFAEPGIDGVDGVEDGLGFFDAIIVAKQVDGGGVLMIQIHEDYAGSSVESPRPEYLVKFFSDGVDDFLRGGDGLRKFDFEAGITELLRFQKEGEALGEKVMATKFNTSVFDIFRELGKDEFPFFRRWGEGSRLGDGGIVVLLAESERVDE